MLSSINYHQQTLSYVNKQKQKQQH